MRSLATLVFIVGVGVLAVWLAGTPTVAEGRVMEAELLDHLRAQGVTGIACDPKIPIGRRGASFQCTVTLGERGTQALEVELDRESKLRWKPIAPPIAPGAPGTPPAAAISPRGDPWSN
jgi:hypothetical protein